VPAELVPGACGIDEAVSKVSPTRGAQVGLPLDPRGLGAKPVEGGHAGRDPAADIEDAAGRTGRGSEQCLSDVPDEHEVACLFPSPKISVSRSSRKRSRKIATTPPSSVGS
jgi:hypothetical protein